MKPIQLSTAVLLAALSDPLAAQEIYVPDTVSPQAREELKQMKSPAPQPANPAVDDLDGWKREFEKREAAYKPYGEAIRKQFGATVTEMKLGGVPVLDVRPRGWKDNHRVLVYVHGGGYTYLSAAASLIDAVPVADATGLRIISVDYTRAPVAKWPQITDEVIAVVRALETGGYAPGRIAMYGDSAGGGLVAGAVLKLRDKGYPMPGAIVLWSPWSDITDSGDTYQTLKAAEPMYVYEKHLKSRADAYADPKDQKNPYVSPVYGDYSKGFPPTLIQGGTKEIFLSNFVRQYQAIDSAGQVAKLDLYEGMWHDFQESLELPESKLAIRKMKEFLEKYMK